MEEFEEMEIDVPLDLSKIKNPQIKDIIERLKLVVRFELKVSENSIILNDDYVMHKNKKYGCIPIEYKFS